jgi:1-deoxy-D-xylulose-5-phosphate synthase
VALQHLPVIFAIDRAGVVGEDGPTHHGVFDLTFLRMVPNLVIMAPADENELRHMLATALAREDGPSAIRYPRGSAVGVALTGDPEPLPLGKARSLRRGDDLALLAIGSMVAPASRAAELLARKGIEAEVVDMRFVKPLDEELLADIWTRHRLVLTVEEGALTGGFGSAVLEWAQAVPGHETTQVWRLGIPDRFQDQASRGELLSDLGLDAEGIARTAGEVWATPTARRDQRTAG